MDFKCPHLGWDLDCLGGFQEQITKSPPVAAFLQRCFFPLLEKRNTSLDSSSCSGWLLTTLGALRGRAGCGLQAQVSNAWWARGFGADAGTLWARGV